MMKNLISKTLNVIIVTCLLFSLNMIKCASVKEQWEGKLILRIRH